MTIDEKEKKRAYYKAYYEKNREVLLKKQKVRSKQNYRQKPETYKARSQKWREANLDRVKELQKFHADKNRDRINQRSRDWYKANTAKARVQTRLRKLAGYGLTQAQFDQMLADQKGKCAICEVLMKAPRVDHCHQTGAVRGLLCMKCNAGLGMFNDNREIVKQAGIYLTKSSSGATSTKNSGPSKKS